MKKTIILFLFFYFQYNVQAQQVTGVQTPCDTASQGIASNFIINYTIGEMPLVQSLKVNGLQITQGILQPYTNIADSGTNCFSNAEVKVFPNPNPGTFQLQLSLLRRGKIQTMLVDASGKKIQAESFDYTGFTTKQYNIQTLANWAYFLQLLFTDDANNKTQKCCYTILKN